MFKKATLYLFLSSNLLFSNSYFSVFGMAAMPLPLLFDDWIHVRVLPNINMNNYVMVITVIKAKKRLMRDRVKMFIWTCVSVSS